ncbi:hypothetical protein PM082_012636 [Marasmius tenuissimus]|nr:hypothetical protein PM082_012636 [Marasmius tenuissimus]
MALVLPVYHKLPPSSKDQPPMFLVTPPPTQRALKPSFWSGPTSPNPYSQHWDARDEPSLTAAFEVRSAGIIVVLEGLFDNLKDMDMWLCAECGGGTMCYIDEDLSSRLSFRGGSGLT